MNTVHTPRKTDAPSPRRALRAESALIARYVQELADRRAGERADAEGPEHAVSASAS